MSLYKKTLFFVSLAFILLTIILYSASRFILLHGFRDLEDDYTLRNAIRMQSAISERISQLSSNCADWAEWDDTYAFVRGGKSDFIQANMADPTFVNLRINALLIVSPNGTVVYSKAYDQDAGREIPFPEGFRDHLKPGGPLLSFGGGRGVSGMIMLGERPALVASRAILTSGKKGPSAGILVMARFFDARSIHGISQLIHHPVTVLPLRGPLSREGKEMLSRVSNPPHIYAQPRNGNSISGYLLLRDLYGKPLAVARVDMYRDIYHHGRRSMFQLFLGLSFIGLLLGGIILLIVERGILARLSRLVRDMREIESQGDVSGRLTVEGNDEITSFASEMNRMMQSLQSAQEELQASEERMRAQYRGIPLPTATWRRTGEDFEFIDCNDASRKMTGGKITQYLGGTADCVLQGRPVLREAFERCWREQTKVVLELRDKPLSLDVERFLKYSLNFVPPNLILLHVEDISERKQAEGKLLSMQRKLRSLTSELSMAEERERRRVAMHLHDDIGHGLALCQFRLEALQEKAPSGIAAELEEIRETVVAAINETRSLTFQLCPPVLYDLGLTAAMDWLGEQTLRKHGLRVSVREEGGALRIETELRALLFQSARELLFNVVKHAGAKSATITIRSENSHVLVMVEDDGRGFDASAIDTPGEETGGFGLFNIRERLTHIGGNLDIHSAVGAGTRVTLSAPLQKRKGAKHEGSRE